MNIALPFVASVLVTLIYAPFIVVLILNLTDDRVKSLKSRVGFYKDKLRSLEDKIDYYKFLYSKDIIKIKTKLWKLEKSLSNKDVPKA